MVQRIDRYIVMFAFLLFAWSLSISQTADCGDDKAKPAESEAATLRTWDTLYSSYLHYRDCDDGAIAEGYSESVARILVDKWSTLPRLNALAGESPDFLSFVIRHIDATIRANDVQKIKRAAKTQCPKRSGTLCEQIIKQTGSILPPKSTHK